MPLLANSAFVEGDMDAAPSESEGGLERDPKKKKPTPTSSENLAVAAMQHSLDQ